MSNSLLARGLKKIKRKQDRQRKQLLRGRYKEFYGTLPVDPDLVILEARNGRAIDGNIYYILRELLADPAYGHLSLHVVTEDEQAEQTIRIKTGRLKGGDRISLVRIHSEDYYRIMASAGWIINDASIPNFFIKKEGQVYLNVWHGTPLKTMGRKVSHEPHATGNVQKNFIIADYLLYPSDYMMDHMIEDYMIADLSRAQVLMGGYPRNSVFFDGEQRLDIREKAAPEGRRIYAYMPTWRPGLMGEALQKILAEMDGLLEEDEIMYVNVHPLAEESVDFAAFSRVKPFPREYETYEFLNIADGLLTDYSSVFYDFAVSGRKIVLLTYDEEEYFETRGLYEPISSLPFPQVKTAEEAVGQLRTAKEYDDGPFLEKYCAYESPEAARALCREVLLGEHGMEHRSMPANGRPNRLVWGGDLSDPDRAKETMAYLAGLDPEEANIFLTFNRADLKESYPILFDLPEGIDYIGRAGAMWLTPAQQEASDRYEKGKISFEEYWKSLKPAFALERKRFYGDMRIDEVIRVPGGADPGRGQSKEELEFSTYGRER